MRRHRIISVGKPALASKWLFAAVITVAMLVALQYRNSKTNRQYREKLSTLSAELAVNQSDMADLRHLLSQPRFQGLTLRQDSTTEWEVETPAEFGATNWVLYVEVSNSNIVNASHPYHGQQQTASRRRST